MQGSVVILIELKKIFAFLKEVLLELFFPRQCCHCGELSDYLCPKCLAKIEFQLLPVLLQQNQYLDDVYACCQFTGPVRSLVKAVKYKSVVGGCELLAELMYYYLQFPKVDYLVSVPISKKRRLDRGFNQSEEIIKHLMEFSHFPGITALEKSKDTLNQARIFNHSQRYENIKGSFSLFEGVESIVKGKTVAIIDDVVTTGVTLDECARLLKSVGVTKVYGVVVAHGG